MMPSTDGVLRDAAPHRAGVTPATCYLREFTRLPLMSVYMRGARYLSVVAAILACTHIGCGSADSGVSAVPPGYAGDWTGTSSQGTTFGFSVSEADIVSSITLTYNVSAGCSGTLSYTNLALSVHRLDPPGPPPFDQPGFGFAENTVVT